MQIIDSTPTARLVLSEGVYQIQRWHPRSDWFTAFTADNERAGRAALGSLAESIHEMDHLSAETLALR